MTNLQIRVLAALPGFISQPITSDQICRKVHSCECLAPAQDRIKVVIHELIVMGLASSSFLNTAYRRTKGGDDAIAALQDLEKAGAA